ncbi:MAG: glycosyltransferase family 39 protein [Anaerolineae bacterium]|nr:glycosyltransferase family 39 protein [Anaerolineae bacterium]
MTVNTLNNRIAATRFRPDDTQPVRTEPALRITVTLEVLIYVALAVLALTLRLVQLGNVPLDDAQAHQALAALRMVNADVVGGELVAESPLTLVLNAITFTLQPNGGDAAARFPVALGGVLLVLAPALWRRYVNPLPALLMAGLLALSPVALLASRTMSPAVWTMLLTLVAPWLVLRYVETRKSSYAIAATAAFLALVLLTEPGGFLMLLALGFGVLFAVLTDLDDDADSLDAIRELLREWPWINGLIAGVLVIVGVGTLFYWLPSGLTSVGNTLYAGVRGFLERPLGQPVAFPLWVLLRYEFGLALFGLLAVYRAIREGGFFERALVGWFLASLMWSVGYAGAGAGHALWLVVPLAALTALSITNWLTERANVLWDVPHWAVPLHAIIVFAVWQVIALSIVLVGKHLLVELPAGITAGDMGDVLFDGIYNRNANNAQTVYVNDIPVWDYILGNIQVRTVWAFMFVLVQGVLFFLSGSLWGARAAWRGFALGTLSVFLLFGISLGGRAALLHADDVREYFYADPVTDDVHELRASLQEMSLRATGEPHLIDITAWLPDDGALAWALRDYPNVQYVDGVGPEVDTALVLLPEMVQPIPLGGDYISKDLITREAWSADTLSWKDMLMWLYKSDTAQRPTIAEVLRLWVRNDVYGVEHVTET